MSDIIDFGDLGGFGGGKYEGLSSGLADELRWQTYTPLSQQNEVWSYLREAYPDYAVSDDPRFRELALSQFFNGWTGQYFAERLQAEDWGRAIILQQLDLAQAGSAAGGASTAQRKANLYASLRDTALQLGLQYDDATIQSIANNAIDNNWDNANLIDALMADADPTALVSGDITGAADELMMFANSVRSNLSATQSIDLAVRIARGELTIQGAQSEIRSNAAQTNPAYATLISQGLDLNAYDAYRTSIETAATRFGVTLTPDQITSLATDATHGP